MAHEVEKMVYRNEVPWHGLGTAIEPGTDYNRILELAGLNWLVAERPLFFQGLDGKVVKSDDSKKLIRDTDGQQLATVGARYKIIQHIESMKRIIMPYVESGQVEIESAGSLRSGQIVWMLGRIKLGDAMISSGDATRAYLLFATGHDGKRAALTKCTNTRVVCANTLSMAENEEAPQIRVHHKGNVDMAIDSVAKSLDLINQQFAATAETYKQLYKCGVNTQDLEKYFKIVFDVPEKTVVEDSRLLQALMHTYKAGVGQAVAGDTMWGAYNAVSHFLTHERGRSNDTRLGSLWLGTGSVTNAKALSVATTLVKA